MSISIFNQGYVLEVGLRSGIKLETCFLFSLENLSYAFAPDPTKNPILFSASQDFSQTVIQEDDTSITTNYRKEFFLTTNFSDDPNTSWLMILSVFWQISKDDGTGTYSIIENGYATPDQFDSSVAGILQNSETYIECIVGENSMTINYRVDKETASGGYVYSIDLQVTSAIEPLFFNFSEILLAPSPSYIASMQIDYFYAWVNNGNDLLTPTYKGVPGDFLPYTYMQLPMENLTKFFPLSSHRFNIMDNSSFLQRKSKSPLTVEDVFNAGMLVFDPQKTRYEIPFDFLSDVTNNCFTLSFWMKFNSDRIIWADTDSAGNTPTTFDNIVLFEVFDGTKSLFSFFERVNETDLNNPTMEYVFFDGTNETVRSFSNNSFYFFSFSVNTSTKIIDVTILDVTAEQTDMVTNTISLTIPNFTNTPILTFGGSISNSDFTTTLNYSGSILSLANITLFNNANFYNGITGMDSWQTGGVDFTTQTVDGPDPHYCTSMLNLLYQGSYSEFSSFVENYLAHKIDNAVK